MTPNTLAYRALVSKEAVKVVQRLLDEQRVVTRAIDRTGGYQGVSFAERDAAEEAIYRHIHGVEAERDRIRDDRMTVANEVMTLRFIVQLIRAKHPLTVIAAEEKAGVAVRAPEHTLEAFEAALDTAVANGHAVRLLGRAMVTYAGLLALLDATGALPASREKAG